MTDREKIASLIEKITKGYEDLWVSLLPIKIGASVWDIYCLAPREGKVVYIGYDGKDFEIYVRFHNGGQYITKLISARHLNRTFFLSYEDALRSLSYD